METKEGERKPKKFDLEIIKEAIKYLCEEANRSETLTTIKDVVERRLGKRFRSSLVPLFKSYSGNFFIEEVEDSTLIIPKTTLELCAENGGKRRNCEGHCNKLHICKFFILSDSCKIPKSRCNYGHDTTSSHNKTLLTKHNLDHLEIEELRNLFKNPRNRCQATLPPLCKFYVEDKECRKEGGANCSFLHLCKQYVTGSCKFARSCRKSHDLCNSQVKDVLQKYGINTHRRPKEILADLKSCFAKESEDGNLSGDPDAVSNEIQRAPKPPRMERSKSNPCLVAGFSSLSLMKDSEIPDEPDKTSVVICIHHLRKNCRYGDECYMQHKDSMYQWQFKGTDDEWIDFKPESNVEIEQSFSDVTNVECIVNFRTQIKMHIDFIQMRAKKQGALSRIRRLSTESTAVQKFQPLATEYKWFWEDQCGRWILYGEKNVTGYKAMLDSDSLETSYQENPIGQMKFKTHGHDYIMDFQRMVQKNVVHKTERDVRRRPVFVSPAEIEVRRKRSADTGKEKMKSASMVVPAPLSLDPTSYIPTSWSFDKRKLSDAISDHFNLTLCQSTTSEASQVKKLFHESMPKSFNVVSIKRIENGELWMNFVSKREKMRRKKTDGNVNELQLFHGTNEGIVDAICRQGFDFRFSGSKTGHKYGKGSYFAKMAQTADSYTDVGTRRHMFVVRVLVGDHAQGDSTFVRPPPKNPRDPFELYDSCVDDVRSPSIFVIFTFDQVYPEYLIEYQRTGK